MITEEDIDRADHLRAEAKENPNADLIAGLREMADFLDVRPTIQQLDGRQLSIYAHHSKETLPGALRLLGTCTKDSAERSIHFRRVFTGGPSIIFFALKESICERVQVGEELLPAIPAIPERVVPIFEWKCKESFLKGGAK